MQERKKRQLDELKSVQEQISQILSENTQLRGIETKCARDNALHSDETRSSRMNDRSGELRHNSQLLAQLGIKEAHLKQNLGM